MAEASRVQEPISGAHKLQGRVAFAFASGLCCGESCLKSLVLRVELCTSRHCTANIAGVGRLDHVSNASASKYGRIEINFLLLCSLTRATCTGGTLALEKILVPELLLADYAGKSRRLWSVRNPQLLAWLHSTRCTKKDAPALKHSKHVRITRMVHHRGSGKHPLRSALLCNSDDLLGAWATATTAAGMYSWSNIRYGKDVDHSLGGQSAKSLKQRHIKRLLILTENQRKSHTSCKGSACNNASLKPSAEHFDQSCGRNCNGLLQRGRHAHQRALQTVNVLQRLRVGFGKNASQAFCWQLEEQYQRPRQALHGCSAMEATRQLSHTSDTKLGAVRARSSATTVSCSTREPRGRAREANACRPRAELVRTSKTEGGHSWSRTACAGDVIAASSRLHASISLTSCASARS
eukprot:m.197237 g.197237  ORF g.197237 m.197237 type:complete len:408 (+) comp10642_c0_seq7:454-1677(+)